MRPFVERDRNQVVDIFGKAVLGIDTLQSVGHRLRFAHRPQIDPGLRDVVFRKQGAANTASRLDVRFLKL